jgi:flagellar M-ring protein FliF
VAEILKKVSGQVTSFWTGLSKKKKIGFVVLMSLIIILTILTVALLNRTEYSVLYSGLTDQEAGEIYTKLTESGTVAKVGKNGTILVPKNQEDRLRISLAAEGYPKTALNYDIFKNSTGFGTTEYEKQKYMQFQLQDRLQETIKSIDLVEDAIVTITIPDNNSVVLKEDKKPSTASVLLKLKNNAKLSPQQVYAITELVSKSVPGLTSENITIVDQRMQVLNQNTETEFSQAGSLLELERQVEENFKNQLLGLLEPVFGYGKVVAGVNVRLDFDKRTTESVKFEPVVDDEGLAVSLNRLEEVSKQKSTGTPAGQDPNGGAPVYAAEDESETVYEKVSNTVNYEVNQTRELIEKSQGEIKDLTVSVVIDYEDDPLVLDQVRKVVSGAMGIEPDSVVVQAMKFNGVREFEDLFGTQAPAKDEARNRNRAIATYAILGLLLICIFIVLLKLSDRGRAIDTTDWDETAEEKTDEIQEDRTVIPEINAKHGGTAEMYRQQIEQFYRSNKDIVIRLIKSRLNGN